MYASRIVHMFPKQRDLMGFDEVRVMWFYVLHLNVHLNI